MNAQTEADVMLRHDLSLTDQVPPERTPVVEVPSEQAAAEVPAYPQPPTDVISDSDFAFTLKTLHHIRTTILFEKVKIQPEDQDLLDFSNLNTLQVTSETVASGRRATLGEWKDLEKRIMKLPGYLSDRQIAKVQLNRITGLLLLYPIYLLLGSVASLIFYLALPSAGKVPFFILWLATTGGLGSAAFIYVNALSIQVDPTVDVISPGLVSMRVVLGMLFAIILTLPFGFDAFQRFAHHLGDVGSATVVVSAAGQAPPKPPDLTDGLMLLLPFILGFSTPLVLAILNRFVQSAQSFFGVQQAQQAQSGR